MHIKYISSKSIVLTKYMPSVKLGMLQSTGSQRIRHDFATKRHAVLINDDTQLREDTEPNSTINRDNKLSLQFSYYH